MSNEMTQQEWRLWLIDALLAEDPRYDQVEVPQDVQGLENHFELSEGDLQCIYQSRPGPLPGATGTAAPLISKAL